VLDSENFSTIIYILYVSGLLRPPVVNMWCSHAGLHTPQGGRMAKKTAKAGAKKKTAKKK
jgi:hypothetical protein